MTPENLLRYEEIARSVRARHLTLPLGAALTVTEDEKQDES